MATLATQIVPHTGIAPAYASAAGGGDKGALGDGVMLHVKNGDSASHTVTLAIPGEVDGLAVDSRTVTVSAGSAKFIPLVGLYKNPSDGLAHWTYDGVTSVTVAVVRASS
jgi:hypothetical protein